MPYPCILALLIALTAVSSGQSAKDAQTLWPRTNHPTARYGESAFTYHPSNEALSFDFNDKKNSDDYTALDLGSINLSNYTQGGFIEIEAIVDAPILRISPLVAEPSNFWETRQVLEGGAILKSGKHTYRFYLDALAPERAKAHRDNLYVFIQDLGGESRGSAKLAIDRIQLAPPSANWREEKASVYAVQYNWPDVEDIEPLYYEELDRATEWKDVSASPTLRRISLNGTWQKKNFGENTWNYAFLGDIRYATDNYQPGSDWSNVTVPEPETPEQSGGHTWYRREIDISSADFAGGARFYLRFDDIADDARIFLNGQLVGTQVGVEKRIDWVAENGSRHRFGVNVEKGITWQHFDRVGVPFPFDRNAVPKDANRAALPIYSGQSAWPLAYDVTNLVRSGKNTLAVRVYGNPMKGWWIFRHRDDRSSKNIHGILGNTTLSIQPRAVIASFTRPPPGTVALDGKAEHVFSCAVLPQASNIAQAVLFRYGENSIHAELRAGAANASFRIPVGFTSHVVQAAILDAEGNILETREITFNNTVIEVTEKRSLLLNGEPFFVRGINAVAGVEWNNDRRVTRREFLRSLRLYQQFGLNTLRIESAEDWQIEAAWDHGFMVMPTTAACSTDWSMGAFGQLVKPDLRQAWDRQRLMTIHLRSHPNILLWNGGNEIHHTPGYDDRPVLDRYIEGIRTVIREQDPDKRPVTYANLDMLRQNWFFYEGQDIVGWNTYKNADGLRADFPDVLTAARGRPLLFTEWGMEKQSSRKDDIDTWEREMRGKWEIISTTPGSIGGMIFAWHGELDDDRGRQFLQDMFLTFELATKDGRMIFKNRSESAMRNVSFTIVTNNLNVPLADLAQNVPAGSSYEARFLTKPPTGGTLEVRYETHGGLRHFFTKKL